MNWRACLAASRWVFFVGLGEDDIEGYAPCAQLAQETEVYGLRLVAAVYEHKYGEQVGAVLQVAGYHLFPGGAGGLRYLRKAIARQVHDIERIVDEEMVDELGLAGCVGCFGELALPCKHIYQRRLAHIRAAYKGVFGHIGLGAAIHIGAADDVFCGSDFHESRKSWVKSTAMKIVFE